MYYNKYLINEIELRYERMRSSAKQLADENLKIASENPKFANATKRLKGYSFEIATAKYNGNEKEYERLIKEREELQAERKNALAESGLTEKDLLPRYACKNCSDTGISKSGTKCKCYYKIQNEVVVKELDLDRVSLPSFNDDTLSKQVGLDKYYSAYESYVRKFGKTNTFINLFYGNTGAGKSFLAGAIANALSSSGHTVLYISSTDLNKVFLKYHTSDFEERQIYFDILTDCDLLVIDDLGCEPILKNVTAEYLYSVVNKRFSDKKDMLITTNLTIEEIDGKYGDRLVSRLTSKYSNIVCFNGEDLRKI